ncbi:MAG: 1-acyl-sn-glycerol-3-phosphate acyltransferase [Burkholderiales bacterium]|jgi:1-acyl-sn-glycerol-3-phosphate acyltransferase|nr:1-acyl-sn-glycerol-3-phosphate acyltransferase [Burkholderiales bacterium]
MSALRSFFGSILFAIFQAFVTVIFVFTALLFFWADPIKRYPYLLAWPHLNLWGARVFCGIRHRVIGKENIPNAATPHIVLSKHSSTWDVCSLPIVMPRPLCFVAKRELLWIPVFGWGFKLIKPITINRKAGREALQQMRLQGRQRLSEGFWIIIFPEGTRVLPNQKVPYKTGGAHLACDLNVPIIPVAHNAGYFWPRGFLGKRAGEITLSIGAPIDPAGRDAKTVTREVEAWIEAETARLVAGKN